jgi:L-ascorbate metabolism protein UlaG (beta-lactamase superfamily)
MVINKLGHCCLVIKDQGKTILTDPGAYTEAQNNVLGVDIVLISHEHPDHLHVDSLKKILTNNPAVKVVTNSAVGKILARENIAFEILEDGQNKRYGELLIEAFGNEHADIYPSVPKVQNTGYFIASSLYYPGDSFHNPGKQVEILALPVVAPWMHLSQCIDYALALKPKTAFPVHDAFLKFPGPFHMLPKKILEENGIKFIEIEVGKDIEV